jgi:hypothetical protein
MQMTRVWYLLAVHYPAVRGASFPLGQRRLMLESLSPHCINLGSRFSRFDWEARLLPQCISIHASLSLRHQISDRWLDERHIWKWTNLSLVDLGTKMQAKPGGFIHSCLSWCNLWALMYLTSPTFDCDISINGGFLASLHEKTVKKW